MQTHGIILDLFAALGYQENEDGCCHGISVRWIEACLAGQETLFLERIQKMVTSDDLLIDALRMVQTKKGKNLTEEDKELLDILAFSDSLELFHVPFKHPALFDTTKRVFWQHDVQALSPIASSDAITAMGGLSEVYSEPVIYDADELKEYLDQLSSKLDMHKTTPPMPLGIILSSANHTIALTYTTDSGWKLMDIEQYPPVAFNIEDTGALAEKIRSSFNSNQGLYRAFNALIFTTGNNALSTELESTLRAFKESHIVTEEIAQREELNSKVSLAYIAAAEGHADIVSKLATQKGNLSKVNAVGRTPAFIATLNKDAPVIAVLAKHGADFSIPSTIPVVYLLAVADTCDADAIERAERFIDDHSDSEETLEISPYELVCIMGNEQLIQLMNPAGAEEANDVRRGFSAAP